MSPPTTLVQMLGELYKTFRPCHAGPEFDFDAAMDTTLRKLPAEKAAPWYRPSSLGSSYSCDRKKVFRQVENIWTDAALPEDRGVAMMRMLIGTAVHDALRDAFAPSRLLFGHWRCPSCHGLIHRNSLYPGGYCPNVVEVRRDQAANAEEVGVESAPETRRCYSYQRHLQDRGAAHWHYEELKIENPEINLRGSADGVLILPSGWYVMEMKTTGMLKYDGLQRVQMLEAKLPGLAASVYAGGAALIRGFSQLPVEAHVTQASIYGEELRAAAARGELPLDADGYRGVMFVYICRDDCRSKVLKLPDTRRGYMSARSDIEQMEAARTSCDLTAKTDPTEEAARVDANRKRIKTALPAACSDRNDAQAKVCPWRLVCFPYVNAKKNVVTFM